jgi:putative phosphoesterase
MLLGIVSDTHGHLASTRAAVRMLESLGVATVLHCGDIGSTAIVELFAAWPTHFVRGNVDDHPEELRAAIQEAGQTYHGRFGELVFAERRIAFMHGDDAARLRTTINCGEYDLVCYGHTHQQEQHLEARTLVLNPGALYRAKPHSLAVVRMPELEATHIAL